MNDKSGARKKDTFLPELIKVIGFASAFASLPLFASMENLQPPWPTAVAYISSAVIIIGALLVREYGEIVAQRTRRRLLLLSSALTVAGLFLYLYLYSDLVMPLANDERLILGFTCTADAQRLYPSCPNLTEAVLAGAGYEPEMLYTPGSLQAAKLSLVAAWMLFTSGLAAAAGWAIVRRQDETATPPSANGPSADPD